MAVSLEAKKRFLRTCIEEKDAKMVDVMLKVGTPLDSTDILMAIENADYATLKVLFKYTPDWLKGALGTSKMYNDEKETILHVAARSGNVRIIKQVLDYFDKYQDYLIRELNGGKMNALQVAAGKGDLESVIFLSQQCLEYEFLANGNIYGMSAIDLASGPHKEEMKVYLASLTNELKKNQKTEKTKTR